MAHLLLGATLDQILERIPHAMADHCSDLAADADAMGFGGARNLCRDVHPFIMAVTAIVHEVAELDPHAARQGHALQAHPAWRAHNEPHP